MTRRDPRVALTLCVGCLLVTLRCAPDVEDHEPGREIIYQSIGMGEIDAADRMLDDCWLVAERFEEHCFDGPPRWDEDPFGERYWRFVFYALRPTSHLLYAYEETGDERYRDKLIEILWSFVDSGVEGIFFWDPHTAAFRAMVLTHTYWNLRHRGDLPDDLEGPLRDQIEDLGEYLADADHFEDNYNHGVNEATALLVVAENFPEMGPGACDGSWSATALARLDALTTDIVFDDGVEVEQSPFYHLYVLSFFWEIQDWAGRYGVSLPEQMDPRIELMVRYLTYIAKPDGEIPLIGSSTQQNIRDYKDHVFSDVADANPVFRYVYTAGEDGEVPPETTVLFPDAGQIVMRSGWGIDEPFEAQTWVFFDVGHWTMTKAHTDALQVLLYGSGRSLVVDSGTYTYESGDYYDHYTGTASHNTVVVDEASQLKQGSTHPRLSASGDGWTYRSGDHELYDGVRHWRAVVLVDSRLLIVIDDLVSDEIHTYDQTWQLHPDLDAEGDVASMWVCDSDGIPSLAIHQADTGTLQLLEHRGSTDPLQGWYSADYEERLDNLTLQYRVQDESARFATVFAFDDLSEAPAVVSFEGTTEDSIDLLVEIGDERLWLEIDGLGTAGETFDLQILM